MLNQFRRPLQRLAETTQYALSSKCTISCADTHYLLPVGSYSFFLADNAALRTHYLIRSRHLLHLSSFFSRSDERSVECGATDPSRPSACCSGLTCQGKNCIDPDIAEDPTSESPANEGDGSCAGDGKRSQQCGATRSDFPSSCCEGLVCQDALEGVKCVVPAPGAEPVSEPAVEDISCAASGGRSQECGATRSDLPASCCIGLVCEGDGSVKCIDAPDTPEPTKAPVMAPTKAETSEPTEMAADPTASPTMLELEPTGQPTPEIVPTSSATDIATKAALITTAVVVPMFFF